MAWASVADLESLLLRAAMPFRRRRSSLTADAHGDAAVLGFVATSAKDGDMLLARTLSFNVVELMH